MLSAPILTVARDRSRVQTGRPADLDRESGTQASRVKHLPSPLHTEDPDDRRKVTRQRFVHLLRKDSVSKVPRTASLGAYLGFPRSPPQPPHHNPLGPLRTTPDPPTILSPFLTWVDLLVGPHPVFDICTLPSSLRVSRKTSAPFLPTGPPGVQREVVGRQK